MNLSLKKLLEDSNSRSMCDSVLAWIGNSPKRFAELMDYVNGPDKLLQQRAAYPMSYAIENNPELIKPHYKTLLDLVKQDKPHAAIRRNILRALEYVDVPKKWQGLVMDTCFRFITDPKEKPAVKASCITVLGKLARKFPEILPEIKLIVEENWDHESAAFRARAKRELSLIAARRSPNFEFRTPNSDRQSDNL